MAGKARLVLRTPQWVALNNAGLQESALPECQYLLDAVQQAQTAQSTEQQHNSVYRRVVWILDLFAALEARQQAAASGHNSALGEGHS